MQELYIDILSKNIDNINMSNLSMGTNAVFETVIKFGAILFALEQLFCRKDE